MNSERLVFDFQYDRKSEKVTKFNRDEFKSPLSFEDFFNRYLNKNFLFSDKNQFDFGKTINFFHIGNQGTVLSVISMDEKTYHFRIQSIQNDLVDVELLSVGDNSDDKDFLTGVYSRSYLFHYLLQELNNFDEKQSYLLMIDLDNFKQINDNFGHIVGDSCLRAIADKLSEIFKGYVLGRYGGDEFLVYLHDVSEEKMLFLVQQTLKVKFKYEKGFISRSGVTCSVGITSPLKSKQELSKLIEESDEALYHSKRKGKNSATIYPNRFIRNDAVLKEKDIRFYVNKGNLLFQDEIRSRKRRNHIVLMLIICFFIVLIASVSFNFNYISRTQTINIASQMSQDRADDVQSQTIRKMNEVFTDLNNSAKILDGFAVNYSGKDELLNQLLSRVKSNTAVSNPAFLLEDGSVFISPEEKSSFVGLPMDEEISQGHPYVDRIDSVSFSSNKNMIVFGIPYQRDAGLVSIKGLLSLNDIDDFSNNLFLTSFLDSAYFAILDSNGTKICDNGSKTFTFFSGNNIFFQFEKNNLTDYMHQLSDSFDKDNSISLFKIDNTDYFFYNQKLTGASRDWVLLSVIPYSSAEAYLGNISRFGVIYFNVLCVFSLLVFLVLTMILQKTKMDYFITQYTDPLTKSINEQRFFIDGATLIKRDYQQYYMIYLNIKRFKLINSQNGSEYANVLLTKVSQYLNGHIQANEIVSREYSDRFVILLHSESDSACDRRVRSLLEPLSAGTAFETEEKIHLNVGVYKIQNDKEPVWLAIDRARTAIDFLFTFDNINGYRFFDGKMMEKAELEIYIEQSQEAAMRDNAFQVYYQGKFNLAENRFTSAEALVRWKDEHKGFINTQTFVDVFERNGFIVKLDLFVFEQVLKDITCRLKENKTVIPVSINLSRRHFDVPSFFDEYEALIRKYQVPGKFLEFEITESVILNSSVNMEDTIKRIHALGSSVSIDDFGSGFSNFSMINHIDFDVLKIDKKLLSGKNGFDKYSKNILKMIVLLNKSLDKTVVCEGVEHKDESDYLKDIGCDLIQGYYYCKPQPLTSFEKLLDGEKDPLK